MRRVLALVILLVLSFGTCHSKIVKKVFIMNEGELAGYLGVGKYVIDSLVINGYPGTADFATLRDCTINGNLRGIDMSKAQVDFIPERAFASPKVNDSSNDGDASNLLTKLEYITLPKDLRWIEDGAFMLTALKSVSLPRLNSIGLNVFANCPNLKEVSIHQMDVPRTYGDIFGRLPEDATLLVPTGTADLFRTAKGFSAFKNIEESDTLFKIRSFNVGEGLPTLDQCLADEMLTVDSLVVTGSLREADFIPMRVGCCVGRLSGIDLSGCKFMDDKLPWYAFNNLSTEKDPHGDLAWNIRHFHAYYLRNVRLPEGLKIIGGQVFERTKLQTLQIPSTVVEIGGQCFDRAEIMNGIRIPEGVRTLALKAFDESNVRGFIYLPSTLQSIGEHCFVPCYQSYQTTLDFYCNRRTPPVYDSDNDSGPFGYDNLPQGWTLYVPVGAKAAFESDPYWKYIPNIIETPDLDGGQGDGINAAVLDDEATDGRIFTLDGRYASKSLDALQSGIYVVNGKKIVKQ